MNEQHREIRAMLSSMAPRRAVAYIEAFELPGEEAEVLIDFDVRCLSVVQISALRHISPETVKKRRKRAYTKIADWIKNSP